MRQLIVTTFLTADGVMEDPSWTFSEVEFDEAAYKMKGEEQEEAGALLLGRVSYDEFAPVWPSMTEEFPLYNTMPKYVVSTTLDDETVPWGEDQVTVLGSLDDVRRLKQETEGGPISVHGSGTLAQNLAAAGLVDRYHLLVFPLLLGTGKRLFGEGNRQKLSLVESETYRNGVMKVIYDVQR